MDKDLAALLSSSAQREQSLSAIREAVATIRAYYVSLVDEGFTEEQAMVLTMAFQEIALTRKSE